MIEYPEHVMKSNIDDEIVLMNTKSGDYYSLNSSAAAMIESLMGTDDLDESAAVLHGIYEVSIEELRSDMKALLKTLVEKSLILTDLI